eukprot:1249645-Prymnesium_polylepis.1
MSSFAPRPCSQAVFVQAPGKVSTVIALLAAGMPQHGEAARTEAVHAGMREFIAAGRPIVEALEALFARVGLEDLRQRYRGVSGSAVGVDRRALPGPCTVDTITSLVVVVPNPFIALGRPLNVGASFEDGRYRAGAPNRRWRRDAACVTAEKSENQPKTPEARGRHRQNSQKKPGRPASRRARLVAAVRGHGLCLTFKRNNIQLY